MALEDFLRALTVSLGNVEYRTERGSGCPSRMLKNSFSARLLKKVQMQGGAPGTHPQDGCRCEAYLVRTSQRRASAPGTHPEDGCRRWAFFGRLLGQVQLG